MESTNPWDNFHTSLIKNNPKHEMIRKYFWGSVGEVMWRKKRLQSHWLLFLGREKTMGCITKLVYG